jgi:electron transport complex protein RnfG
MSKRTDKASSSPLISKQVVSMILVLFCITVVCAFVLAYVNGSTYGVISSRNQEKLDASMKEAIPEADSFELTDFSSEADVAGLYLARAQDRLVGYCVTAEPSGFGGKITLIVGVDLQGTVKKVLISNMTETPGLGTKAQDAGFLSQYEWKTAGIQVNGKSDNKIDAITGATVTSKAVTSGVNAALSAVTQYQTVKGGGKQ